MYFRYESLEEIKEKFNNGDVLSGLTTKIDDTETLAGHFWIAYGKERSKVNIVPIVIYREDETSNLLCGMSYHKYTLAETKCLLGLSREDLDDHTSEYRLLLLYRDNSKDEFGSLYEIVFDDWKVIDNMGGLCPIEFAVDAMSL